MAETGYTIPLSNANITTALQRSLNPDTTPQSDSEKLITSGGVKAALGAYMAKGTDYVTAGQKSGVSIGYKATAEGLNNESTGNTAHAEGTNNYATGAQSHAEGGSNIASGGSSHAEGSTTQATEQAAHAEGMQTTASGMASHVEGRYGSASGNYSHAQGYYTIAASENQSALGKYNVSDSDGTYAEIVGNGTANNSRSNARTLDWEGNEVLAGKLTIGADPVDDMDVVPKKMLDAVAITDTASGSIASFSDGADDIPMRSVKAQIEPVQDLHGYENPWPAGGGKNKLPMTLEAIKALNTGGTWNGNAFTRNGMTFTVQIDGGGNAIGVSVSGTASAQTDFFLGTPIDTTSAMTLNGCPSTGSGSTYRIVAPTPDGTIVAYNANDVSAPNGVNGNVLIRVNNGVSVSNVVFKPMIRLSTETDATFAPYSNECPISGWTGVEVTRTGGNLIDYATIQQGAIVQPVNANRCCNVTAPMWIKAGTKITISRQSGTARIVAAVFSALPPTNSNVIYDSGWQQSFPVTLTIPKDGWLLYNWASASTTSAITPQDVIDCGFKAEFGTSATPLTPTNSNTYERVIITFGNEIFGGAHNFTTGELKDDWKSVDLGTFNWGKTASNLFYLSNQLQDFYRSDVVVSERTFGIGLCSQYQFIQEIVDTHPSCITLYYDAGFSQTRVFIRDDTKADMTVAEFKAAMSGVMLVYKTTDVQTHLLIPQQITSLLGQNNVWSNTGDTEVTYVADPKLYVDKRITELFAALSQ